jgi:hypothetical protein
MRVDVFSVRESHEPGATTPVERLYRPVRRGLLRAAHGQCRNHQLHQRRSDSFSTLCVIASLLLYQYEKPRRFLLYLLPAVIGIWTKQTTAMLVPILFLQILLFEEDMPIGDRSKVRRAVARAAGKIMPVFVLVCGMFLLNQIALTPESTVSSNKAASKLAYFATQWHVVVHYLQNSFVPLNLSAEPDLAIIDDPFDSRIMLGLIVVAGLLWVALTALREVKYRPVAFGIFWFFLALMPTSSFVPLYQIANDHRTFFPYVGIVLTLGWTVGLFILKHERAVESSSLVRYLLPLCSIGVIGAYGYGAHQRNEVWSSDEALWYDVTVKSPATLGG